MSNGQVRLITDLALYSDGTRYPPAVKFLNEINEVLPTVRSLLVLGTGLGSIISVIQKKGFTPVATLVDFDEQVLSWAMDVSYTYSNKLTPVCSDAAIFIEENKQQYDLVFLDVFLGKFVPSFVLQKQFLVGCCQALTSDGIIGMNYIVNDPNEWENLKNTFSEVFSVITIVSFDLNRILIGRRIKVPKNS